MLKKACTYTGFVCAQMVLFAALMLTNTGMGIHVITIVLVLLTYFIAALKNVLYLTYSLEFTKLRVNRTFRTCQVVERPSKIFKILKRKVN